MLKQTYVVLACASVIQILVSGHVLAQSAPSVGITRSQQYFQWNSGSGAPLLPPDPFCGDSKANQDERAQSFSVQRDLGEGVNVRVGIGRKERGRISATLLFRYYDGKLKVTPENIELHIQGMDTTHKPRKVEREAFVPKNSNCQQLGEWVQLEFVVESDDFGTTELRFPTGTAIKQDVLNIRPFGFKSVQQ